MKIILSDIKKISVNKLKKNISNDKFFRTETGKYFDDLATDIQKRGILVPLIAKKDGTLLAGHARLLVAQGLGIKMVPVQFVEQDLSPDAEVEFIIKDNLLRRHLAPDERFELYRTIIKNFDERVSLKNTKVGVSIKELAEKTGLNPKTINYDLSRIRYQKRQEFNNRSDLDLENEKAISQFKKSVSKMLNTAMVEKDKTRNELMKLSKMAVDRLQSIMDISK